MTTYETMKTTMTIEAVDIPTMVKMTAEQYQEYLKNGLFFVVITTC